MLPPLRLLETWTKNLQSKARSAPPSPCRPRRVPVSLPLSSLACFAPPVHSRPEIGCTSTQTTCAKGGFAFRVYCRRTRPATVSRSAWSRLSTSLCLPLFIVLLTSINAEGVSIICDALGSLGSSGVRMLSINPSRSSLLWARGGPPSSLANCLVASSPAPAFLSPSLPTPLPASPVSEGKDKLSTKPARCLLTSPASSPRRPFPSGALASSRSSSFASSLFFSSLFSSSLVSSSLVSSSLSCSSLSSSGWGPSPAYKPLGAAASLRGASSFSSFASACGFPPFLLDTRDDESQTQTWAVPKKRVSHSRTRTRRSVWMKRKPKKQYTYSSIDTLEALQQTEGTLTAGRTLHANWLSLPGGVYLHRLKYSVRGSGRLPGTRSRRTENLDFQDDFEHATEPAV